MFIALTGTPGVGKTSVSKLLLEEDVETVNLLEIAEKNNYLQGFDKKRNTKILDIKKLNKYFLENYKQKNIVFIDGHLSYLLSCVEKVIILRCHPKKLKQRLSNKDWNEEKIRENIESEILDVILCDITSKYKTEDVFEIDTTDKSIGDVFSSIKEIIDNSFKYMKKYNMGNIDWSEEILENF